MTRIFSQNKLIILDSVDSTNVYAFSLMKNNCVEEGTIIITKQQKSGKGLGENHWESEPHKNLTFSIILKPEFLTVNDQFILNKAISLGIFDYVRSVVQPAKVSIKWPNDIYVDEHKIAGILIETVIQGDQLVHAIVGIGLNVNQTVFHSDAPNPISLLMIMNKEFDLDLCFFDLLECIEFRYLQLKQNRNEDINQNYINQLFLYRQPAKYCTKDEVFVATIIGVSEEGMLILEKENGDIKKFGFKEIEYVR